MALGCDASFTMLVVPLSPEPCACKSATRDHSAPAEAAEPPHVGRHLSGSLLRHHGDSEQRDDQQTHVDDEGDLGTRLPGRVHAKSGTSTALRVRPP